MAVWKEMSYNRYDRTKELDRGVFDDIEDWYDSILEYYGTYEDLYSDFTLNIETVFGDFKYSDYEV